MGDSILKSALLLGFCTVAWLAWVPATQLEKMARGDAGGTSLVPVIPLFPILAWLAGPGLNLVTPDLGLFVVGGVHVLLTGAFIGSAIRSKVRVNSRRG